MEIKYLQEIKDNKYSSFWFGGIVATIEYKGYTLEILAQGDIKTTLLLDNGEEIHCKDKHNASWFNEIYEDYIKDDNHLIDLIQSEKLQVENNNWFELVLITPNKEYVELNAVYQDNIKEIINSITEEYMEELIKEFM